MIVLTKEIDSTSKYWTGEFTESGNPMVTTKLEKAKQFKTRAEGYAIAGHHKCLDWWRVVKH